LFNDINIAYNTVIVKNLQELAKRDGYPDELADMRSFPILCLGENTENENRYLDYKMIRENIDINSFPKNEKIEDKPRFTLDDEF